MIHVKIELACLHLVDDVDQMAGQDFTQMFPLLVEPAKLLKVAGRRQAAQEHPLLVRFDQLDQVELGA